MEKPALSLRDHLAQDRTHLANERTLLAYLRTSAMCLISGVTLVKLFPDDAGIALFAAALVPTGVVVGVFGVVRFVQVRRHMRRHPKR